MVKGAREDVREGMSEAYKWVSERVYVMYR